MHRNQVGHGLNTADELKNVTWSYAASASRQLFRLWPTFLGAHAVSRAYSGRQSAYVDMLIKEMIPEVGRQQLAKYIDVFCDEGFFTVEETARILEAGARWGASSQDSRRRIGSFGRRSGGRRTRRTLGRSPRKYGQTRHCNATRKLHDAHVSARNVVLFEPTLAPARAMLDAGLGIAVASDYNPGSTPSGDMKFIISLSCIKMRLMPAEAINAATINSA